MKKGVIIGIAAATAAAAAGFAFIPSCNQAQCVYGPPPEQYEPANNEPVEVYGPPVELSDYDPSDNIAVCVYGPPSYFQQQAVEPGKDE